MSWSEFSCALMLLAAVPHLQAGPLPKEPEPAREQAASTPEAKPDNFDLPLPLGMPVNGIRVPQYDEDGKMLMLLEAATAKRIDDTRIEMEDVKVEASDEDGRKIFVELPYSIFNLESRILTGDKSALIRREDFEITGDSIDFNTKTRFGTMRGNIKMVISTDQDPK